MGLGKPRARWCVHGWRCGWAPGPTSALIVALALVACGDAGEPVEPDAAIVDPADPNCPDVEPTVGPYAMKGTCCYRASNQARLQASTTGKVDLEFRMMSSQVISQPRTIGAGAFLDFVQLGYDSNRSVSLIRVRDFPIEPPGDVVIESGPGRFNDDGTYSFLRDAAPTTAISDDNARWNSHTARAHYDPAAADGMKFAPLDPLPAMLLLSPEWGIDGELDYELPQYAPAVLSMTLDADLNCIGARGDATRWVSHDSIESFIPVDWASRMRVRGLGFSLCTAIAFGFRAFGGGTCEGTRQVDWFEPPTAFCANDRCHVGDADDERATCTSDPDAVDDEHPLCCDPQGMDAVLPACNAFHVVAQYVAAAVEITDEPVSDGRPVW